MNGFIHETLDYYQQLRGHLRVECSHCFILDPVMILVKLLNIFICILQRHITFVGKCINSTYLRMTGFTISFQTFYVCLKVCIHPQLLTETTHILTSLYHSKQNVQRVIELHIR